MQSAFPPRSGSTARSPPTRCAASARRWEPTTRLGGFRSSPASPSTNGCATSAFRRKTSTRSARPLPPAPEHVQIRGRRLPARLRSSCVRSGSALWSGGDGPSHNRHAAHAELLGRVGAETIRKAEFAKEREISVGRPRDLLAHDLETRCTREAHIVGIAQAALVMQRRVEDRPRAVRVAEEVVGRHSSVDARVVILQVGSVAEQAIRLEQATALNEDAKKVVLRDVLGGVRARDEIKRARGKAGVARVAWSEIDDAEALAQVVEPTQIRQAR